MTDAELCRANGWTVGTVLEGGYEYDSERIQIAITAIGEDHILARRVWPERCRERLWTLTYREWRKAEARALEKIPNGE